MEERRIYRDQLLTVGDLVAFKNELIFEFRKLLKELAGQPTKKWLKSVEVQKILGISMGTLQNLRNNGTLPYTKVGGVIYYDSEDIQNTLSGKRNNAATLAKG
jgi:hypothetical protein